MSKTHLTKDIHRTQGISGYDAAAKLLFSCKIVIAFLLAALVPGFQGIDIQTIADKYVDPFHSGERIMGLDTDSLQPRGRGFRFGLLVEILTPSGTLMLLNIEIQRAFHEAQSIFERAWLHVNRIFRDLDGTFAANQDTKVCGLWILTAPPKKLEGTVTYVPPLYDVQQMYPGWSDKEKMHAAPLQNIMVCAGAGNPGSQDYEKAADFVHVLLDPAITAAEKIQSLTNEFELPMGTAIKEVLTTMGNFGTDVLMDGRRQGACDANVRALSFMTTQGKMSLKDAMNTMGLPLADEAMYAKLLNANK